MIPERPLKRLQVLICLTVLVLIAATVRARGLSTSVYGDEAFHFAAADRYAAGQGLTLAPDVPYRRALPFTEAVIACRSVFGDSEWAQRLPAFLASLGCVVVLFFVGARWFGPAVGLLAAAILALDFQSVFFGSYARFYSAAQFFSLVAVYAFERGFAESDDEKPPRWARVAVWAIVAGAAFLVALSLQVLALAIGFEEVVFLVARAVLRGREGRRDWRRWPEVWILGAAAAVLVLGALVASRTVLARLAYVPLWNLREGLTPFYYVSHLRSTYPFESLLACVGVPFALSWKPRAALLAASFFLPAFLVQSLLPQKIPRYVFLLLPYFFLLAAAGYLFLFEKLRDLGTFARRRLWSSAALALVVVLLVLSPSASEGGRQGRGVSWVDWRTAIARVAGEIRPSDAVVAGAGDDLFAITQYTGRADAHVCTPEWAANRLAAEPGRAQRAGGPYGIPCLSTVADFDGLASRHGRAWVFLRTDHVSGAQSRIVPEGVLGEVAVRGSRRSRPRDEVTVVLLEGR